MNNKEVLEFITDMERELIKVDAQYERRFLIMRAFLYDSFRNKKTSNEKNKLSIVKGAFINLFSLLFFSRLMKSKEIVVSPSSHFNLNIEGKKVSKHVEGIKSKYSSARVFSVGTIYRKSCFNLSLISRFYYSISGKKYKEDDVFLKDFKKTFLFLSESKSIEFSFSPDSISHWLSKVNCYIDFYKFLIPSDVKVEKAIFIAYYDLNSLALIEALKQKEVECIDYQHGIQNDCHPMYSKLSSLKKSIGLPNKFWGWDHVSKKRIVSELGVDFFREVGNLWVSTEIYKNSVRSLNRPKKTILVALQLWPNYFNNEVFDVINDNKEYLWVFREHPLNLVSDSEKRKILNTFNNVVFEDIKNITVESSIDACLLCMTGYSTVALEAFYIGRKALFFHENAKNGLSSYIDNKAMFYADNKKDIQKVIDMVSLESL
jgi:hypothetical protein